MQKELRELQRRRLEQDALEKMADERMIVKMGVTEKIQQICWDIEKTTI